MHSTIKYNHLQKWRFRGNLGFLLGGLTVWSVAVSSAQNYAILHTFGTNEMGLAPYGGVVQGPDGTLYGTTGSGGALGYGQVFKVNPDGSGYVSLKDFNGIDSASPSTSLLLSGNQLYGTAANGGTNGLGAVFKLNTDGSDFSILKQFTGDDGGSPNSALIISGTTLFGTLGYAGGNHWSGAVFKINNDGTDYEQLHIFSEVGGPQYTNTDGAGPTGVLLVGNVLYGTAVWGGSLGYGAIYKVNLDGTGFVKLYDFDGTNGASPQAGMACDGTALYGIAPYLYTDGFFAGGEVFRLNMDGASFAVLKNFTNATDPAFPTGGLVLTNSTLYGTSTYGGQGGCGTVFSVRTDGSEFTVLTDLTNLNSVITPNAGLTLSGSTLLGTGWQGGAYAYGGVFKIQTNGSGYGNIVDFRGGDGVAPYDLTLSGSTIYGATPIGGSSGCGTLFKIATDGTGYLVLKDFTNSMDGLNPGGSPVVDGQVLYGLTQNSADGGGAIYKLNTDGSGYTVLRDFTNELDGCFPFGKLALSGSTLFGVSADGGISNCGTVFRINTDGSGFQVLKHFRGNDGAYPYAGVEVYNGMLYGTTAGGGTNGYGTVFTVGTNGQNFSVLRQFSADWTIDGASPDRILLSDNVLYGVTSGGGFGYGTLFKENTDGSGYTIVKFFTNDLEGAFPSGQLAQSQSTVFGTTQSGGKLGGGAIYQINTDGSGFAVLKNFTQDGGSYAPGGCTLSGSTLYGATASGGALNSGVLYALSLLPEITTLPQTRTIEAGSPILLQVDANGSFPLSYEWLCNGTNLPGDNWTNVLELPNLQCDQSGTYILVITNAFGSVTSTPVMLSVIPQVNRRPVPAINLTGSPGGPLTLQYADDLANSPNWMFLDTVNFTNTSQFYCDSSDPLPASRFYRAWQAGTPANAPSLSLPGMVPAITLTGSIGEPVRLDYIKTFGPTNAWMTLDIVILTNTIQPYFDVKCLAQPARLYRVVPLP